MQKEIKREPIKLKGVVFVTTGSCEACIANASDEACELLSMLANSYCAGKVGHFDVCLEK